MSPAADAADLDAAPSARARLRGVVRRARRLVLRRRRLLAVLLAGVAVLAGLRATAAPPPATVPVPVLARSLPAGAVVGAGDLRRAGFAPGTVPDDVVADPVGRVVATGVARGEPLTAVRLVGAGMTAGGGRRALPVRFPDAGSVTLLSVGDRIDLLAVDPQSGVTTQVAVDVPVLALPAVPDPGTAGPADGSAPGRLTVLGVDRDDVAAVADASVRLYLVWSSTH